jgi:micrococcal nuclease
VQLSLDGRDVGRVLIAEGLAVPYSGGRRIDWCARLT